MVPLVSIATALKRGNGCWCCYHTMNRALLAQASDVLASGRALVVRSLRNSSGPKSTSSPLAACGRAVYRSTPLEADHAIVYCDKLSDPTSLVTFRSALGENLAKIPPSNISGRWSSIKNGLHSAIFASAGLTLPVVEP